jgi:hypothetical protein
MKYKKLSNDADIFEQASHVYKVLAKSTDQLGNNQYAAADPTGLFVIDQMGENTELSKRGRRMRKAHDLFYIAYALANQNGDTITCEDVVAGLVNRRPKLQNALEKMFAFSICIQSDDRFSEIVATSANIAQRILPSNVSLEPVSV